MAYVIAEGGFLASFHAMQNVFSKKLLALASFWLVEFVNVAPHNIPACLIGIW
jgi:hypothetical protein